MTFRVGVQNNNNFFGLPCDISNAGRLPAPHGQWPL